MNRKERVLVIDDERGMRDMLRAGLGGLGYRTAEAAGAEEGLRRLAAEPFDLVLTDLRMPGVDGLALLAEVKKASPRTAVVVMTGSGTIEAAVEAMKRGAADFLQKPFELHELQRVVDKALERKELEAVIGVYEASRALFRDVRLEALLPAVAEQALAVLRADDVSIAVPRGGAHELACARGAAAPDALKARLVLASRAAGGGALAASAPLSGAPFDGLRGLEDVKSVLLLPLAVEGRELGVLCACRTRNGDPFDAADERHLAIFGAQIALALRNAQAFRDLQEAQARLRHSERLNALGQMAAGVAHELNNPLTAVLGHAQFLLSGELTAQQREDAAGVMEHATRCRSIIDDLLRFGRKEPDVPRRLRLADEVAGALQLARFDRAARALRVSVDVQDASAAALAVSNPLKQVFLNLIVNAAHAMAERETKRLDVTVRREGGRVLVRFADTGCGIPADRLERVFEPFFTTKEAAGTGLGLALCREILARFDGVITAESAGEGRGAAFTVSLPACEVPAEAAGGPERQAASSSSSKPASAASSGGGT